MSINVEAGVGVDSHALFTGAPGNLYVKTVDAALTFNGNEPDTRKKTVAHNATQRHMFGEIFEHPNGCQTVGTEYATPTLVQGDGTLARGVWQRAPHMPLAYMPIATRQTMPPFDSPLNGSVATEMPSDLTEDTAIVLYGLQAAGLRASLELAEYHPKSKLVAVSFGHIIPETSGDQLRPRTLRWPHYTTGALSLSELEHPGYMDPTILAEQEVLNEQVTKIMAGSVQEHLDGSLEAMGKQNGLVTVNARYMAAPYGYAIVANNITPENITQPNSIRDLTTIARAEQGAYAYAINNIAHLLPKTDYLEYEGQQFGRVPFFAYRSTLAFHPYPEGMRLVLYTAPMLVDSSIGAPGAAGVFVHKNPGNPTYNIDEKEEFRGLVESEDKKVIYDLGLTK